MADSDAEFPTTIGPDAVIKGELRFEKGVRLLGSFEGEIDSKGQLVIAEGAKLSGQVRAGSIRVDGQVKGNLNASSKVQLSSSGRLEGDIEATRLEVAEGAVLIGRCVVGANGKDQTTTKAQAGSNPAVANNKGRDAKPLASGIKKQAAGTF